MNLPPVWILTFDRPHALNRLIETLGDQGFDQISIFSNHPKVQLTQKSSRFVYEILVNNLNSEESNSWCARSWNTMYMKHFGVEHEGGTMYNNGIFIQDDTMIGPHFNLWIEDATEYFDFIWGPAGNQFHYTTFNTLKRVGWWDERYIGCYCGDAEYVKRVYMAFEEDNNLNRLSVEDSHNWGFQHNPSGISQNVITTYQSKTIDPNYNNQHWQFEQIDKTNPTIIQSQSHFIDKWGVALDNNQPVINSKERRMKEIDWYPWYTKKHGIRIN